MHYIDFAIARFMSLIWSLWFTLSWHTLSCCLLMIVMMVCAHQLYAWI